MVVGSTLPPEVQGNQGQDQRYRMCDQYWAQTVELGIAVERTGLLLLSMMMLLQPLVHLVVRSSKSQAGLTLGPRPALMPWAEIGLGLMGQS